MTSKRELYFTGKMHPKDPRKPLPGELPRRRKVRFLLAGGGILLFGLGVTVGLGLSPETPEETRARMANLEAELKVAHQRILELDRAVHYKTTEQMNRPGGQLKPEDRKRHEREARRYARAIRAAKAQGAADLIQWFITRWDSMLDQPGPNDRPGRRAELLARLVGGMAQNLHPADYVPWQAEFFSGNWLGDLHFDLDGDGYPQKRSGPNPHDGFTDTSVCQIAMALNQTMTDGRVLVMPELRCDAPDAKMSIFLQGKTINDAVDDFVAALKAHGFLVRESKQKGLRLVLVGQPRS